MKTSQSRQSTVMSVIHQVIIGPQESQRILLGVYESCIPQPRFILGCQPDTVELLGATLQRKDQNGDYTLTYFLRNYSNQPCNVTILEGQLYAD